MRMPNGYGTVYKLGGKRRRPWIARKTVGWSLDTDSKTSKQEYLTLGYYSTRQEALQALSAFNDNPYDLKMSKTTFEDIYNRWFKEKFDDESNASTVRNYTAAYKYCAPLYKMKMSDIRPPQLQSVINSADSYNNRKRIQTLFSQMYDWCIRHDCIKKDYSLQTSINLKSAPAAEKNPFTLEEIQKLWSVESSNEYISLILMLIYSGVRISELLNLKKEDVDLDEQYFYVRQAKTSSGVRVVPIADKVLPFWQAFMNKSTCEFAVCNANGKYLSYENFKRRYWKELMSQLNMQHTIHETRHTFISQMVIHNVNMTIIKKIVGHKSIMNLTERVYTHFEISELLEAVNKI
ncbi:MAG TPA: site-specific integrase [Ruminococcaceae bacterium]|nr:site-specific integrase [Oscillospiraceae bacterium]